MKKCWEGEISCCCGENHLLCCYQEKRPNEIYNIVYSCSKTGQDVNASSRLIKNFVGWVEMPSSSKHSILCKIED